MVSEDFRRQMKGYGLTTARIWYFHPDYPSVINENWLLWQEYDLFPKFPELKNYLSRWGRSDGVDTKIAFVQVMHVKLIKPAEIKAIGGEFRLH